MQLKLGDIGLYFDRGNLFYYRDSSGLGQYRVVAGEVLMGWTQGVVGIEWG